MRIDIKIFLIMVKNNTSQLVSPIEGRFKRRKDLTMEHRLSIAFMALMDDSWGIITKLARDYAISRTFVYMLQFQLYTAVANEFEDKPANTLYDNKKLIIKKEAIKNALMLRLVGKCSIPATSEIMKKSGLSFSSVGSISQVLNQIGSELSGVIAPLEGQTLYVHLASDEVFAHSRPILISADPISSAILNIEMAESRKTSTWINHFNQLKDSGVNIIKVVSDEGTGLRSATSELNISRQPDTFHAISLRLGKWVNCLENAAYAKIDKEYHQVDIFNSAKSEHVLHKRLNSYIQAKKDSDEAIEFHDNFKFLYNCIIEKLQVFDKNGNPNNRLDAEQTIRIALDFMVTFPVIKLKKAINTIYNLLDELLAYLDIAHKVTYELTKQGIPRYVVNLFSLGWQYEKNQTKAKNIFRNNYYNQKKKEVSGLLKAILKDKYELTKLMVYSKLDTIIQSSAIVENINSIIRDFLNTSRNHMQKNMLNLIMFYHNHRRYRSGKRKGKTPMELLTGQTQELDWIDLLFQDVSVVQLDLSTSQQ